MKSAIQPRILFEIKRYLLMTLGILIMAIGIYFFKFPNNFTTGGVTGLSLILGRVLSSSVLTPSRFVLILNVVLLLLGFLFLGGSFAFGTVYCSILLSVILNFMELLFPMNAPLTSQPLLELCYAVLLPAVGSAILFNLDASSGGTDIVAMIVRKYTSLNIGLALMVADALITVAALFVFGPSTGLYSILGLLSKSLMVDYVIDSLRMRKCCQIVTDNPEPILSYVTTKLHRGATIEEVSGAYTRKPKTMVITVLTRSQCILLRRYLHQTDPHCFLVITNSTEIIGRGFLPS